MPMFYLLNKYKQSNKILKEVYAKVILMKLNHEDVYIEDKIVDEILKLVSLEDLARYGANACSLEI